MGRRVWLRRRRFWPRRVEPAGDPGRRGYDETTAAYTLAIARPVGEDRYDVAGWTDAFAVSGGDYTFTHDGLGRVYSSCQDDERVRGEIRYGAEAGFTADLPPFSSRTFGYRAVTAGPPISAHIETIETSLVMRQELKGSQDAGAQVHDSPGAEHVRTIVLSSTLPPKGATPESLARASQLQGEIAADFPGSRHVFVTGAGHYIQKDKPDVVINAARELAGCGELPARDSLEKKIH